MAPRFISMVTLLVALVVPFHGLTATATLCMDLDKPGGHAEVVEDSMPCCDDAADSSPVSQKENSAQHPHCQAATGCCTPGVAVTELVTEPYVPVCAPSSRHLALSDGFHPETLERPPLVS